MVAQPLNRGQIKLLQSTDPKLASQRRKLLEGLNRSKGERSVPNNPALARELADLMLAKSRPTRSGSLTMLYQSLQAQVMRALPEEIAGAAVIAELAATPPARNVDAVQELAEFTAYLDQIEDINLSQQPADSAELAALSTTLEATRLHLDRRLKGSPEDSVGGMARTTYRRYSEESKDAAIALHDRVAFAIRYITAFQGKIHTEIGPNNKPEEIQRDLSVLADKLGPKVSEARKIITDFQGQTDMLQLVICPLSRTEAQTMVPLLSRMGVSGLWYNETDLNNSRRIDDRSSGDNKEPNKATSPLQKKVRILRQAFAGLKEDIKPTTSEPKPATPPAPPAPASAVPAVTPQEHQQAQEYTLFTQALSAALDINGKPVEESEPAAKATLEAIAKMEFSEPLLATLQLMFSGYISGKFNSLGELAKRPLENLHESIELDEEAHPILPLLKGETPTAELLPPEGEEFTAAGTAMARTPDGMDFKEALKVINRDLKRKAQEYQVFARAMDMLTETQDQARTILEATSKMEFSEPLLATGLLLVSRFIADQHKSLSELAQQALDNFHESIELDDEEHPILPLLPNAVTKELK